LWGLDGQWEGMIPIITDCVRLPQWRFEDCVAILNVSLDRMLTAGNIGIMHVHLSGSTRLSIPDMQAAENLLKRSKRDFFLSAIITMGYARISWYVWGKHFYGWIKFSGEQTRVELPGKSIIMWDQAC